MSDRARDGSEQFHRDGTPLGPVLLDFWRWADSDLLSNALRGRLAEYIVATDLGIAHGVRAEWIAWDLTTPDGLRVEVKSAAYVQSWKQRAPSAIAFDVRPTLGWDPDTAEFGTERKRHADVYVFCLLGEPADPNPDPLDMNAWRFFVISARRLNEAIGHQKRISLRSLQRLSPRAVVYGQIAAAIKPFAAAKKAATTRRDGTRQVAQTDRADERPEDEGANGHA